jgi:hypothetical protein
MAVELLNDGPVTIVLDIERQQPSDAERPAASV